MRREEIELLAPAGSYEGFEAAIGAGADAVYVGGAAFGARAYAKNFGEEELLRAIDTAHIHGRKLYLTVNTLLKNRELSEQLYDYLLPYYKEGLDAVIVQDMGVFKMIREMFPGMHLHASTQMTVTGPEGMKFLEQIFQICITLQILFFFLYGKYQALDLLWFLCPIFCIFLCLFQLWKQYFFLLQKLFLPCLCICFFMSLSQKLIYFFKFCIILFDLLIYSFQVILICLQKLLQNFQTFFQISFKAILLHQ